MTLGMRGYWTDRVGALRVTFDKPSQWERVWAWLATGAFWTSY